MADGMSGLAARIAATQRLHAVPVGSRLKVSPRRSIGARGPLRLLWPAAEARLSGPADAPRISVTPDGWAWLVWLVLAGASAAEMLMDRAEFPRDYPAYAPFLLLGVYTLLMMVAVVRLSGAVRRAIAR